MPYIEQLTDGNRNNETYNNLCLAYKTGKQELVEKYSRLALDAGLPPTELKGIQRSAQKSNIANSGHINSNSFKTKTRPSQKTHYLTQNLASEFNSLPQAKHDHPYIKNKQVKNIGIKENNGQLVIPFSKIENPQFIQSWQTISREGKKLFKKGHELENSCFQFGHNKKRIYVAEGWATAMSIHALTDYCVMASGNKGRLTKIAKEAKAIYPKSEVIICLDNDGKDSIDVEIPKGVKSIMPFLPHDRNIYDYNDYMINDRESAQIELVSLAKIKTLKNLDKNKIIKWLVKGYIPMRALSLLIGDKGAGKTTYAVSLAVEMIIKFGSRIIYFSNENDAEVVIMNIVREKVKSIYQDKSDKEIKEKFEYIRGKFQIIEVSDNPMNSVKKIEEGLKSLEFGHFCMGILDPIADVIKKLTDNEEARPIMTKLRNISEKTGTPFLLTLNRKKNIKETELIDQGMGAGTIVNVPKVVLYLKKIKGEDKISILFKVANNYGTTDGGMLFSYKPGQDKDGQDTIGCLEVDQILTESRDDLVDKYIKSTDGSDEIKSEKADRLEKLRKLLKTSPCLVKEIRCSILEYKDKTDRLIQKDLKEIKAKKSKINSTDWSWRYS